MSITIRDVMGRVDQTTNLHLSGLRDTTASHDIGRRVLHCLKDFNNINLSRINWIDHSGRD